MPLRRHCACGVPCIRLQSIVGDPAEALQPDDERSAPRLTESVHSQGLGHAGLKSRVLGPKGAWTTTPPELFAKWARPGTRTNAEAWRCSGIFQKGQDSDL